MEQTPATEAAGAQTSALMTVAEIRAKLLEGTAPVPEFAQAIGKTARTVSAYIAAGMPVLYVGRSAFVKVDPAIEWLRTRRASGRQEQPRGRGRPRKAA